MPVTTDEPALTHHYHLKSIGYTFGVAHSMGLDKCIMTCIHHNGLPWSLSGKEAACNAGDPGSSPGLGRSPGGGHPL